MTQPKTKDYDVRAAVVSALLANGVPRGDIRHELTLDTYSSGGRADLVILRDTRIVGIELKSGSDVLDRCEAQSLAMDRAFDVYMVIADISLAKVRPTIGSHHWIYFRASDGLFTQHPEQHGYRGTDWTPFNIHWLTTYAGTFASRGTSPMWMASTLWADEVRPLTGSQTRCRALDTIRESFPLKDVRKHTVKQLRARNLGKWELAFWNRYDDPKSGKIMGNQPNLPQTLKPTQQTLPTNNALDMVGVTGSIPVAPTT